MGRGPRRSFDSEALRLMRPVNRALAAEILRGRGSR